MIKRFATALVGLFMLFAFPFHAAAQETSGGFAQGSVKIGYDNRTCDGTLAGSIRYNSATSCAEYCQGTTWTCPATSGGSCNAPTLCSNIGDVCDDSNAGTTNDPVFAGFMVDNDSDTCEALYVTNANQSTGTQWKTSSGANDIATDSMGDGRVNDAQVANSVTFPAFKLCKDLTHGGFTDWYLPAKEELSFLWINKAAINATSGDFTTTNYWSSSEYDTPEGWRIDFGDGDQGEISKTTSDHDVRCVRRD